MDISTTVSYIQLGVWGVGGAVWSWRWLMRKYPDIWTATLPIQWLFSNVALGSMIAVGLVVSGVSVYFNLHRPRSPYPCLTFGAPVGKGITRMSGTFTFAPPPVDKPEERVYTDKTPADFTKFYTQGFTELQSNALMKPFIGLWVHAHGKVTLLTPTNPGADSSVAYLQYGDSVQTQIYCEFPGQLKELSRISLGDQIKVDGKISGHTNSVLELNSCELEK